MGISWESIGVEPRGEIETPQANQWSMCDKPSRSTLLDENGQDTQAKGELTHRTSAIGKKSNAEKECRVEE
jgi:hypothetical protein